MSDWMHRVLIETAAGTERRHVLSADPEVRRTCPDCRQAEWAHRDDRYPGASFIPPVFGPTPDRRKA
jgi:hypothetical protein